MSRAIVHASNPDQNILKSAITQKSPVMKWNLHLWPDKCFYNTHSNSLFSFWPGMENFWMYWRSAWWSFFISTHQCADTRFKSILFHKTFPVSHSNLFFVFNPRSLLSRVKKTKTSASAGLQDAYPAIRGILYAIQSMRRSPVPSLGARRRWCHPSPGSKCAHPPAPQQQPGIPFVCKPGGASQR